jgi:hypothetical protein
VIDGKIEQRNCINFSVKLGKSAVVTLEMLHELFGENSPKLTAVFEGYSRLKVTNVHGYQALAKRQKFWKHFKNSCTERV